ncbi:HDOD domain-containing protein [Bacillus sp. FJAT-49736]|uniref:EAL and HDOD domain-containing protein n=1 Tax=Bacillus sp. FJAT-49736 TaxID=2833582 RepID=UPI001BC939F7|nr:HDOD domain-containing protein [Bacillus sp. FJAT-49736]MBS4173170.1 EAL domain-containing protein [Bacillus sp. FJAT-49736]
MEVFVARQPIFNQKEDVCGYELLYRQSQINEFPKVDGDQATADVIINSFLNIGIDDLSCGMPCFINFTENLLKQKVPTYFRPQEIIVEILENVPITTELLAICKELKSLGYKIALDDFILQHENSYAKQILKYVDIVKIDYLNTSSDIRRNIEKVVKFFGIELLAEKVETREHFEEAKKANYSYFQGYFFSKPVIVSTQDIPPSFVSYFQIIKHLSDIDPSIDQIAKLIEQDLSLSYKLLKLINSPAYRPKHKIHSIRQAIILLGLIEIKRWLYVLAIRENTGYQFQLPNELVKLCLTRAKMCEMISKSQYTFLPSASYFLVGMFSLMDTILSTPMESILQRLPLGDEITDALIGKDNRMREILDITVAIEKADWEKVDLMSKSVGLTEQQLFSIYKEACNWSEVVLSEDLTV